MTDGILPEKGFNSYNKIRIILINNGLFMTDHFSQNPVPSCAVTGTQIEEFIETAVKGLDANPAALREKILPLLKADTTASEALKHLMSLAVSLTSAQTPDWKYAAGRLKMLDIYRQCAKKPLYDYPKTLEENVLRGVYTPDIPAKYSKEEIQEASSWINPDWDMDYDYAGANLLAKRYLCEYQDKHAELPQDMFLTIALLIHQDAPKDKRMARVKEAYELLAKRKISLGTPLLMNLRRPQGNLSSCFIAVMDDSRDSIFYVIDQISAISKFGGGVGCNLSRVRCKGARIKGVKNASGGVIPWIRIINDTAVAVNQQGKRKGAVTVSLDIWHLDIEDFLELRTENGDQRMKAYDVFPQVVIPDAFMRRMLSNQDWLLFDPSEARRLYGKEAAELWGADFDAFYDKIYADAKAGRLELFKFVSAKELMKKIMRSQIETGMPYLAFKDTLNRYNPNKHDGLIVGTNLCTESHSNVRPTRLGERKIVNGKIVTEAEGGLIHVCNLISVNLANIDGDEELEQACRASVRFLDNAIDLTDVPVPEGMLHNRRYRTIGVGAMGLADWLAKRGITYMKSAEYVDELFEKFAAYCTLQSVELAGEKGTFEAYEGSDWSKGIVLGKERAWFEQNAKLKKAWAAVFDGLKKHGIRNSQITAVAPNTSSSLLQGCTASVLPVYSKFFVETHGKGSVPNCPPFIKEKFWTYQENKNIPQTVVIDVLSRVSKWIDTGVSIELVYNLNLGVRAKDMYDTIVQAWQKDIKTLYYTRTIQKDGSSAEKTECVSCAG